MTLIFTALAAVIATLIRFSIPVKAKELHVGLLALIYIGAAVMWCVDGFAALAEGESFVELSDRATVRDDALLGVCVVALGLAVWGVYTFVQKYKKHRV